MGPRRRRTPAPARHPGTRTSPGLGGETRALYCEDINRGTCPDYERGVSQHAAPGLAGVVAAIALAFAVLYLLTHH